MTSPPSNQKELISAADPMGELELTAQIEPFDSFWEGPENIEKGYTTLFEFYHRNYLKHFPEDRDAHTLVVSCGPGYFVDMLVRHGYRNVMGIDSDSNKIEHAQRRGLNCRAERAFPFVAGLVQACMIIPQTPSKLKPKRNQPGPGRDQ